MPNNRVPFGLCKKYHIGLPDDATPRDAWNALREGVGITPDKAYAKLTSGTKDFASGKSASETSEGRAPLAGSSKISEVRKPEKFRDTMTTAKESVAPEDRWRVDVHSAEEYDKDKMYSSEGGSCVAVEPSGNIISVCKREGDVIFGSDLLRHAVENGGDRLDAFGKKLYKFYTKNGFEPVSWVPFNEEYAPEGWSKTRDKAEPVIFYKYTGQQITLSYEEFLNDVKPHESYDEAMVFRDKEMQK